jgi:hypothetical protein
MKKLLFILTLMLMGCTTTKTVYVPTETEHIIEYRDSIIYLNDTIYVNVPYEKVQNIVPDTSRLETSVAKSIAYLDTIQHKIHHTLENKNTAIKTVRDTVIVVQSKTEYLEKPIVTEKFIPTPYIPTIYKVGLWFSIGVLLLVALKFIQYFKGGI